jgi:hypothetical protein
MAGRTGFEDAQLRRGQSDLRRLASTAFSSPAASFHNA